MASAGAGAGAGSGAVPVFRNTLFPSEAVAHALRAGPSGEGDRVLTSLSNASKATNVEDLCTAAINTMVAVRLCKSSEQCVVGDNTVTAITPDAADFCATVVCPKQDMDKGAVRELMRVVRTQPSTGWAVASDGHRWRLYSCTTAGLDLGGFLEVDGDAIVREYSTSVIFRAAFDPISLRNLDRLRKQHAEINTTAVARNLGIAFGDLSIARIVALRTMCIAFEESSGLLAADGITALDCDPGVFWPALCKVFQSTREQRPALADDHLFAAIPCEAEPLKPSCDKALDVALREMLTVNDRPRDFRCVDPLIMGPLNEVLLAMKIVPLGFAPGSRVSARLKSASFYTPLAAAQTLARRTAGKLDVDTSTFVVDPAMGVGNILAPVAEVVMGRIALNHPTATVGRLAELTLCTLYGVDLSHEAVGVARTVIRVWTARRQVGPDPVVLDTAVCHNLITGNSLNGTVLDEARVDAAGRFVWQTAFPEVFSGLHSGFDAVIGNPPWSVLQGNAESTALSKYIRTTYAFQAGKQNLWAAFVERSWQLVHSTGRIGLIVQNSLLGNVDSFKLRRLLQENTNIECMLEFSKRVLFKDVNKGSVLFVAALGATDLIAFDYGVAFTPEKRDRLLAGRGLALFSFGGPTLTLTPQCGSAALAAVVTRDSAFVYMVGLMSPTQGDFNRSSERHLLRHGTIGLDVLHYYQGKDVRPFSLTFSDRFVSFALLDKARFGGEQVGLRIVMQEVQDVTSLRRFTAALLPACCYTSHDAVALTPTDTLLDMEVWTGVPSVQPREVVLTVFTCLLNSKLLEWTFRPVSRNDHVTTTYLKTLPVPDFTALHAMPDTDAAMLGLPVAFETMWAYIQEGCDTHDTEWILRLLFDIGRALTHSVSRYLINAMDAAVCVLYGLSLTDFATVEKGIAQFVRPSTLQIPGNAEAFVNPVGAVAPMKRKR